MARPTREMHITATVSAAVAFIAVLATFAVQTFSFGSNVEARARADLRTQAYLAAASLATALETQDFRRLRAVADSLEEKGLSLRVRTQSGGVIYDGDAQGDSLVEFAPSGEYRVGVASRRGKTFEPFYEALGIFVLAALVGVLGMFVVFFALYRQRVRIRELAETERFRREFVADVSHEIKTPLTGILAASEMLKEISSVSDAAKDEIPHLVGMISKETARLDSLVRRILDLSVIERSRDVFAPEKADVRDIVEDAVSSLSLEAGRKGVRVISRGESVEIPCDAALVREAVLNLVGNAIRHSGADEVRVTFSSAAKGVKIRVEDDGCGIAPEHAARIFERFYRVDASRASDLGGSGLGLAIVKGIAELHGGEASYTAVEPHGSCFTLSIPGVGNR